MQTVAVVLNIVLTAAWCFSVGWFAGIAHADRDWERLMNEALNKRESNQWQLN